MHEPAVGDARHELPGIRTGVEAIDLAVGLAHEHAIAVAHGGHPESLQAAGLREVRTPGPLAGRDVQHIDPELGTGFRRQSAQGVDPVAGGACGHRAPLERSGNGSPPGRVIEIEGQHRVGPFGVLIRAAHLPPTDDVQHPAGHDRIVRRASLRQIGKWFPPIRGDGIAGSGPARTEHLRLGGGSVDGRHAADAVYRRAVRDDDGSLQERPAGELLPRPARFEHQPAKSGADVVHRVHVGPSHMAAVDIQCPVVGDGAEAGNGVDQVGRTPLRRRIVLRGGEPAREGQREDKAGDRRGRSRTSHDVSVARHDDRRLHRSRQPSCVLCVAGPSGPNACSCSPSAGTTLTSTLARRRVSAERRCN